MFKQIVTACIAVLIVGCTGLPDDVEPVVGFDSERYLGTWYEIARLDHSFERNLERVTATYGLNEDGSISVLNNDLTAYFSSKSLCMFLQNLWISPLASDLV